MFPETTLKLFQYVETMLGDECQCGKKGIKCDEKCCPAETEFCHWRVLGRLKGILEEYDSLKVKEAVYWRNRMNS